MLKMDVLGVSSDGHHAPVVLMRNEDRILPIVVGLAEADAIHAALTKRDLGRPMTHDLICNLLTGLRGELQSVTIYKLENDTFYAHLNVEQKSMDGQVEQVLRIDTRPSDGIAIACRVECPVFVSEAVLDQAGQDVSLLSASDEEDELGGGEDEGPDFA